MNSPFGDDVANAAHGNLPIRKAKPCRPIVEMCRRFVKAADGTQRRRSHQNRVDMRCACQEIAQSDGTKRHQVCRNVRESGRRIGRDSPGHPKTEIRTVTAGCVDERRDPVRQCDIVVIKKNDELPASCSQAGISRASDAAPVGTENTHAAVRADRGQVERAAIVNHETFHIAVRLGADGCQGLVDELRTCACRDDGSDEWRQGRPKGYQIGFHGCRPDRGGGAR